MIVAKERKDDDSRYTQGEVQVSLPRCRRWRDCKHDHTIDSATPIAYLPHSCSEWQIGGAEDVKRLVDDLLEVLSSL